MKTREMMWFLTLIQNAKSEWPRFQAQFSVPVQQHAKWPTSLHFHCFCVKVNDQLTLGYLKKKMAQGNVKSLTCAKCQRQAELGCAINSTGQVLPVPTLTGIHHYPQPHTDCIKCKSMPRLPTSWSKWQIWNSESHGKSSKLNIKLSIDDYLSWNIFIPFEKVSIKWNANQILRTLLCAQNYLYFLRPFLSKRAPRPGAVSLTRLSLKQLTLWVSIKLLF